MRRVQTYNKASVTRLCERRERAQMIKWDARMLSALVIVAGLCAAAPSTKPATKPTSGPATQPALHDLKRALDQIPKSELPDPREEWKPINYQLATKALNVRFQGASAKLDCQFRGAQLIHDNRVAGEADSKEIKFRGLTVKPQLLLSCKASDVARLGKLKAGDNVTVSGTVDDVTLGPEGIGAGNEVLAYLRIHLRDATVR